MKFNDAIVGAIFIALAAFMIQQSFSFPGFPGQDYGPNLFPRIIAGGMILCALALIAKGFRARSAGVAPWVALDDWTRSPKHIASFALMIAAMVFYVFASEFLGFIITAFVIQLVLFLWFAVRPVTALVVATVSTLVVQYFFVSLMRVPLPRGLLDSIL